MSNPTDLFTTHNETNFDPQVYIDQVYKNFTGYRQQDETRKFQLDFLHETYKDGKISGKRLLDLGTGPVCYSIVAASRWFDEIVLSDVDEASLALLREWRAGERQCEESVLKYMLHLEDNQEDLETCDRRVAAKVRCIVRADMHRENMMEGTEAEGLLFDAISLVNSQGEASTTLEENQRVVKNYSKLLRPGGFLVITGATCGFYHVGKNKFKIMSCSVEEFKSSIKDGGYNILIWNAKRAFDSTLESSEIIFSLVAQKI